MGKFGVWPILVATMLVGCLAADKDNPNILLRPPGQLGGQNNGPVFSSSIDSIPLASGSQQQSVFSKGSSLVHSSASASASGKEQGGSNHGGRNNNPWYNQGSNGFSFDYNQGGETGSATNSVHTTSGGSGGYYEQPPAVGSHQTSSVSTSATSDSYTPSGGSQQPAYTYYYQHYPSGSSQPGQGGGWSAGGNEVGGGLLDGGFGGIEIPGLAGSGLSGIVVLKVAKVIAKVAKAILLVKPFLILGLLLLIAVPVLLLLLPIPIITITGQPSGRAGRSAQLTSYLAQLSGKVLNSEECLERIICKLPQPPEKYQTKAKLIWDEYGSRVVSNPRVSRGLNAYFDSSSQKNRNLKCDQRFKCSNKYL